MNDSVYGAGHVLLDVEGQLNKAGHNTQRGLAELKTKVDAAVGAMNGLRTPAEEARAAAHKLRQEADKARSAFGDLQGSATTTDDAAAEIAKACDALYEGDKRLAARFEQEVRPLAVNVNTLADTLREAAAKFQQAVDDLIDGADQIGKSTEQLKQSGDKVSKDAENVGSELGQASNRLDQVIPQAAKQVGDTGRAALTLVDGRQ